MHADPQTSRQFRVRKDLQIEPQLYGGEPCFVLKDPVSLAYFRFSPLHYRLLQLIDGRTLPEFLNAARRQLGTAQPDDDAIRQMLEQFIAAGIVTHDEPGQGGAYHDRSVQLAASRRRSWLGNLLYFKLPGIDPEPLLRRVHPWFKWLYTPAAIGAAVLLILFAGAYTLVHIDQFAVRIRQESVEQFVSVQTIFWLWLALGLSKICHEFAHGLTCHHFGGECHEMGVLFLVFSPCLYCDATDAWTMPDKWRRIAVSAAGIYVELVIASVATLVWWHTAPGILHSIALALMTLCSLNTLLLNANPLMRYDGYYILSDLVEVPNLRLKAQRALQGAIDRQLLGLPVPSSEASSSGRRRWPLLAYGVAVQLYQWVLCAAILWFFYTVLKPYRLGSISVMLAVVVAVQILLLPLWRQGRRWFAASRLPAGISHTRVLLTAGGLAALVGAALFVPLPHRVTAAATIRASGQQSIVVRAPGRVATISVCNGDHVRAGDSLAQLVDPDLELEVARLESEVRRLAFNAQKWGALGRPAEQQAASESLRITEQELESRREQQSQLTIRAPVDGRIVFAEHSLDRAESVHGLRELSAWSETPLARHNLGARWETGTALCDVLPTGSCEAILYVEQSQIPFVAAGQVVRIKLDAFPDAVITGTVGEVARVESVAAPHELLSVNGGELPTRADDRGASTRAAAVVYEVRVLLSADGLDRSLLTGDRGRGKIDCGHWTAFELGRRRLYELFGH